MGINRLNRKNVIPDIPKYSFSSVRLSILNPKLFLNDRETVLVERRMNAKAIFNSEYYLNSESVKLSYVKEILSSTYDEELLLMLSQLAKRFNS